MQNQSIYFIWCKISGKYFILATVSKILHKFEDHGTVKDYPWIDGPPVLDWTLPCLSRKIHICQQFHCPKNMVRLNVWMGGFWKQKNTMYIKYLVQEFLEDDYDSRLQFCKKMMWWCDENNGFLINKYLFGWSYLLFEWSSSLAQLTHTGYMKFVRSLLRAQIYG